MESSQDGYDSAAVPPRPQYFTQEQWALVVSVQRSIAGLAAVSVWSQGAVVFPADQRGRILIFGYEQGDGLHPWQQAIVDEVVKRLTPHQDNGLPHQELVALSDLTDSPAVKRAKRENRILGLRLLSATRRFRGAGIGRESAIRALAEAYSQTAFVIGILMKHARDARWKRIERMRKSIVTRLGGYSAAIPEVARRLNVTCQYARRLVGDVGYQLDLEQEARDDAARN